MQIRRILWGILVDLYPRYLRWRYGMDIGKNCRISWKAHLDKSINPKGIHIGDNTWVLSGAMILAHDHCRSLKADTYIGKNCVIGVRLIIMPGLSIGNQVYNDVLNFLYLLHFFYSSSLSSVVSRFFCSFVSRIET